MHSTFSSGHVLRTDDNAGCPCWIVAALRTRKKSRDAAKIGEKYETDLRYFMTLPVALEYLLELSLEAEEKLDLQTILRVISAFREELKSMGKPF